MRIALFEKNAVVVDSGDIGHGAGGMNGGGDMMGQVIQAARAILGATQNALHLYSKDTGLFLLRHLSYSFLTLHSVLSSPILFNFR